MISVSRLYCGTREGGDFLRFGRRGPAHARPVVVWNCTRQCNLHCAHCYSGSGEGPAPGELTTCEGFALLDDLAHFGVPVVLFSGGEPLLRRDIFDLVSHAVSLGLRAVISTNGTLVTERAAAQLREAGASYVGVSLDGMAEANDALRGAEGAFEAALAGVRHCLAAGLKTGLRFTMTRRNVSELDAMFRLARQEGIARLCFYHLVYTGRGAELKGEALDHAATRRAVNLIIDRAGELHAAGERKEVLTVDNHADGPYLYLRMLREGNEGAEHVRRLLLSSGGNASGTGIGCVSWDGTVHPDQFWRSAVLGNVRERPFSRIWTDASNPLLAMLRDRARHLKGRCRECRFLGMCGGGLRARAEAATGDAWAPDPACYLTDGEISGPVESLNDA